MTFGCSFIDFMTLWSVQVRHQRLLVELFLCWVSVSVLSAMDLIGGQIHGLNNIPSRSPWFTNS
jgi:hypothetical protein